MVDDESGGANTRLNVLDVIGNNPDELHRLGSS
jgi:hypothetical protein